MGFLDKAKKLAEQAQSKLDEVQKQVNTSGSSGTTRPSGPVVEYDKHGRPVPRQAQEAAAPPERSGGEPAGRDSGDPLLGGHAAPPAPTGPIPDPSAPPAASFGQPPAGAPAPSFGDPLAGPPAATSGDPLGAPASSAPPALASGPPAPVVASSPPPAPPGVVATEDDDRNQPTYTPPKMTGGDPLAG
jgi:hypothetical protein